MSLGKKSTLGFVEGYISVFFFSIAALELCDKISANTILNISKNYTLILRLFFLSCFKNAATL